MASVSKRQWTYNGVVKEAWLVRYYDETGSRRGKTFNLKKDADGFRRKVERELEEGSHTADANAKTVREITAEYLRDAELRAGRGEIGETRVDRVRQMIVHWNAKLANVRFRDITARQVDELYEYMTRELRHQPFSAYVVLSNLATVERFAVRRGYLKTSPVAVALTGIKRPPKPKIRTFSPDEVAHLLRISLVRPKWTWGRHAAWVACFVHLAAFCGLRAGEIRALDWESVDLEVGEVRVRRNLTRKNLLKGPKSKAGNRDVPMPDHVVEMLRQWRARYYRPNAGGYLFTTTKDKPLLPHYVAIAWKALLIRANLYQPDNAFHFHALRHFAGSWWLENGMKIPDVTIQIGHADPATTLSVYTHSLTKRDSRRDTMQASAMRLTALTDARATQQAA